MNVIKFEGQNLPAVSTLASSLKVLEQEVPSGAVILKMDKTGSWVFGADQTEVQEGSHWAVNPFSFVHGYIAWGDGEVLGEKMVSVSQPLPDAGPAPAGASKGWESQIGCSLKCIDGEDEGTEVRYTTTSVGGKRAVQTLASLIADQVGKDEKTPVPIVVLGTEHYQHKSYGKIFTPVFGVTKWVSMNLELPLEEPAKAEAPAAPQRRRRAPVAA